MAHINTVNNNITAKNIFDVLDGLIEGVGNIDFSSTKVNFIISPCTEKKYLTALNEGAEMDEHKIIAAPEYKGFAVIVDEKTKDNEIHFCTVK